ncbi:hypothetical protein EYC84_004533 [Monilinia fructicola]|uniref:Uncharacterized protein n=1 Tax=Monilinia fructicola TaxID=38448 RepID=A0A5M9K1G0_MONFR|nr:hypothetical protein EYC84_004533 [Monilinia fructicola]
MKILLCKNATPFQKNSPTLSKINYLSSSSASSVISNSSPLSQKSSRTFKPQTSFPCIAILQTKEIGAKNKYTYSYKHSIILKYFRQKGQTATTNKRCNAGKTLNTISCHKCIKTRNDAPILSMPIQSIHSSLM